MHCTQQVPSHRMHQLWTGSEAAGSAIGGKRRYGSYRFCPIEEAQQKESANSTETTIVTMSKVCVAVSVLHACWALANWLGQHWQRVIAMPERWWAHTGGVRGGGAQCRMCVCVQNGSKKLVLLTKHLCRFPVPHLGCATCKVVSLTGQQAAALRESQLPFKWHKRNSGIVCLFSFLHKAQHHVTLARRWQARGHLGERDGKQKLVIYTICTRNYK